MCVNSVPSLMSSAMPVTTCQGVGKITLRVSTTINHHAASNTTMTATAGRLSLILFIYATTLKILFVLHTSRRHGVSGCSSTTTVI